MSSYRIASRAYPTEYWAEHGGEIVATANELNNDKWSFRESRQLLSNGLRTRSFEATGGELRQVWVQGLLIFFFTSLLQGVSGWLGYLLGLNFVETAGPWWMFASFGLALATLTISTRWPAMLFIATCMLLIGFTDSGGPILLTIVAVALTTLPIAVFGNGRRLLSPGALIGILTLATASTGFWFFGPGLLSPLLLIAGLAVVRFDPRLLAAATIYSVFVCVILTASMLFPEPGITVESVNGLPVELVISLGALGLAAVLAAIVTQSTRQATTVL